MCGMEEYLCKDCRLEMALEKLVNGEPEDYIILLEPEEPFDETPPF
ncbi:MAG: hypothetical protein HQK83_05750 [Fibrobacteria bacterium]|nr:hypothetical protein [Fibrobacteria bacterium]